MVFPNVDTCNAVLFALLRRYEDKPANKTDMEAAQKDFEFARDVLDYMHGRSETGCWPNSITHGLMFRFLDVANPEDIGSIAEDMLSTMEARQFLSLPRANTERITLSTYHHVMRYWMQAAKAAPIAKSGSRGVACERAFRLLKKLEVQSMPMALGDSALSSTTVRNLYDIDLRPLRKTYKMVLQICVDTSAAKDQEKAAAVAFEVYRMMIKRRFAAGDDTESLLATCSSRLARESDIRRKIEEYLNIKVSDGDAATSA
jgi:hypothetical protein